MKLIMTLLVRNEEDLLSENIDFHLNQGVDFIIATDNRSTDSTKTILKSYQKKGVLHYIYENEDTHNQGKWVTKMARLAYSHFNADWVINNDADEFWWPINHANLKEAFSSLQPEHNIVEAQRHNFVFTENTQDNLPFYKSMLYKENPSLNSLGSPLPPKQAHRALNNIIVADGNHSVNGFDKEVVKHELIEIFHFPLRSKKQFISKISNGGHALNNNYKLPKNIGITWRILYEELTNVGNIDSYLSKNCFSNLRIKEQLSLNHLKKDTRLKRYFDHIYPDTDITS